MSESTSDSRVEVLDDPARVGVLADPMRLAILEALRTADSASGVARRIGESRQKTNYHVKTLLDAELVEPAGERRAGNFVEQLYRAVASTFLVSPRLAWGGDERARALRTQLPLEHLVALGERLQRDAIALLDRAAFEGDEIPSLAVEAEVRFADAAARQAFMQEYLEAIEPILARHGRRDGERFRVALAVHPDRQE